MSKNLGVYLVDFEQFILKIQTHSFELKFSIQIKIVFVFRK